MSGLEEEEEEEGGVEETIHGSGERDEEGEREGSRTHDRDGDDDVHEMRWKRRGERGARFSLLGR